MLEDLRTEYPDKAGKRHFLVTEVTHMSSGDVCVAGIDLQDLDIVRPLQWNHENWARDLTKHGLQPGRIVRQQIRSKQDPHGFPHQTEDLQLKDGLEIEPRCLDDEELYEVLEPTIDPSLQAIFDNNLIDEKYVEGGVVCRSLGAVLVDPESLQVHIAFDKPRVTFADASGQHYDLSVTDLRIRNMFSKGRLPAIARADAPLHFRIGLARAWAGPNHEYDPRRCFAQVNGIVFPRNPEF